MFKTESGWYKDRFEWIKEHKLRNVTAYIWSESLPPYIEATDSEGNIIFMEDILQFSSDF